MMARTKLRGYFYDVAMVILLLTKERSIKINFHLAGKLRFHPYSLFHHFHK